MEIMTFNTIFAIIVLAQIFSFTKALPLTDDLSYEYSMDDEPSMSANTGGDYYGYDYSQPEPGKYRCRGVMISIEYKHLCDGNPDCDQLDDEDPVVCRQYIDMPSTTVSPLAPASIETTTTSTAAPTTDEFDIAVFDYSDVVCADDEFQCKADPGVCMPNLVICDGESDCSDGEDETFCGSNRGIEPTPSPDQYVTTTQHVTVVAQQQSAITVPTQASTDIDSSSSTVHVQSTISSVSMEITTCRHDELQCRSHFSDCVPNALICDGYFDCWDGSDELGCGCGRDKYMCVNGQCVSASYRCDGYNDCGDYSDEVIGCVVVAENIKEERPSEVKTNSTANSLTGKITNNSSTISTTTNKDINVVGTSSSANSTVLTGTNSTASLTVLTGTSSPISTTLSPSTWRTTSTTLSPNTRRTTSTTISPSSNSTANTNSPSDTNISVNTSNTTGTTKPTGTASAIGTTNHSEVTSVVKRTTTAGVATTASTATTSSSTAAESFARAVCPPVEICLNGGKCEVEKNVVFCRCPLGFIGSICEIEDCTIGNVCGLGTRLLPSVSWLMISCVLLFYHFTAN